MLLVQLLPRAGYASPQRKRWVYVGEHDLESIKELTDAIEDVAGL
ncbi:hypothetical protein NP511_10780 [Natrinema thermotolerans]|uniref:Uncharacterized protein n=1 Tax=Natrinema thermotolerans TaxID=121872 RepID=A0AAF0PF65_9EURY|nr:hypothetical protein [Natrinema thermotolerans]WMT10092.1 hypothetical protein NP511_10780 [Natrinema thermotolerans]